MSPQYPIFICPNCRAGADLEADVDELAEEWQQLKSEEEAEANAEAEAGATPATEEAPPLPVEVDTPEAATPERDLSDTHDDVMDLTVNITPESPQRGNLPHTVSEPLPIRNAASGAGRQFALRDSRTPSPPGLNGTEGPITPRNNAGPWVFDGSAGRNADATTAEMRSLDAAADMDVNGSRPSDDSGSR